MNKKAVRVTSLPVDRGGCGYYRVRQPFMMMQRYVDWCDTHIMEGGEDPELQVQVLKYSHVVVIRQGGEGGIQSLKKIPEFSHLKFVLDIDDNMELINPFSEHYKENGLKEYHYKYWKEVGMDSDELWINGRNGFDVYRNRERVMSLLLGLREADMITVTTERLAQYARLFNKNVVILPNSIDFASWGSANMVKDPKQLRIGWSGGMSHYEDWFPIKRALNKLMRKYKFKLVVIGSHFAGLIDKDLQHLVEVHPWVGFEAHSYRMQLMNLDIALIPLQDMPFNHYKSSIKFHEMSAMGVPSIVSQVPPYADDFDGKNMVMYSNEEEFYSSLESLIIDKDLRDRLSARANDYVRKNFDAQKQAHLWAETYASLVDSSALNEDIMKHGHTPVAI